MQADGKPGGRLGIFGVRSAAPAFDTKFRLSARDCDTRRRRAPRKRPSLRAHDIGELSRMRPHKGMAATINQSTDSAGYSAHESVEVMSRDSAIVRSSDHQRGRSDLFQPRPAVERNEP